MRINLIFHNIVNLSSQVNNKYTVTKDYFMSLLDGIDLLVQKKKTLFNKYHLYFDDGYLSFHELVFPLIKNKINQVTLAIVPNDINKNGFLEDKMLLNYFKKGVKIASHGLSHSALAVYRNSQLQDSPTGGFYGNSPKGQGEPLSEKEIIYQYFESKSYLELLLGSEVNEFVFPYGLYNNNTIFLNSKLGFYKYLSTCDEYLDFGASIKPRILVDHEKSVSDTIGHLLQVPQLRIPMSI